MDDGAVAPVAWWRPGLVGIGAAVPIVWAVWVLAGLVSAADGLGGLLVFFVYGPLVVLAVAAFSGVVVWGSGKPRAERWRLSWAIAAPFVMGIVLVLG